MDLRLGFMASHNGTNMRKIIKAIEEGSLQAKVQVFITNNPQSTGLIFAQEKGVPSYILNNETHPDPQQLDAQIRDVFIKHEVNVVMLIGYMRKIGPITLEAYNNRILNVHPSLLPKYGGKGLFGARVHQAVLDAKEKESGATVHIVDEEYDHGPILAQVRVPVQPGDSVEKLTERIKECEGELLLKVLTDLSNDYLHLPG